ncbi:glutamyl-tRNA(Gln) amidotransferase subunit C, mitochondrial [Linepithema humile]|uniref:glutamyl-tRNA(Gln) amidotransferase subunit C, mitochondrial n=1 Tax=Linepithema humile TaxID=83485 RepID=UPI00351EC845
MLRRLFRTYASTVRARQPVENNSDDRPGNKKPVINETTIKRIEKLALVGFEYEQSKRVLEEAIAFAERLRTAHIDESVRPMYSTLENDHIRLRDDVVHHDVDRREILKNAAVLEEEYFVAPLTTDKSDSKQ